MSRPKTVYELFPDPKNSLLMPQKIKIDPKIKSKSNVRIARNKENESYSTTWVDPKTVFKSYPNPKNSPLEPRKVKNDPKIKSNSNVRIDGNVENESCSTT